MQKVLKKQSITLPHFNCRCGKFYGTLSPLYNHIKVKHDGNFKKYKLDRGVPEGRCRKIDWYEKKFLERTFVNYINNSQQLKQEEIRSKFNEIVKAINEIVANYQLESIRNDLLKLNIKLQPIWINIKEEKIVQIMNKYFYSYLFSKKIINIPSELNDDLIITELNYFLKETQITNNSNSKEIKSLSQEEEEEENQLSGSQTKLICAQ